MLLCFLKSLLLPSRHPIRVYFHRSVCVCARVYKIRPRGGWVFEVQNQHLYIGSGKGLLLGNIVSCRNTWEDFFAHFFVLPKTPHESPHPRKQSRRVNNLRDRCDQDSFSPRRENPGGAAPPCGDAGPGLWYLSLCQACYRVNSVQRIVIFLSLLFLLLVVLLCFFFPSFHPTPSVFETVPAISRTMKLVALRHREGTYA